MVNKADVLVVTVTEIESRAVLQVFQSATGQKGEPVTIDDRIYFNLGILNNAQVFLTQSEMGISGLDASLQTVSKGIRALKPSAVIMVGIAFGINDQKQSIGEILVTEQLRPYDLQRMGTKDGQLIINLRADKPHASPWLINHFKSARLYWDGAKVRFGVMLTGEKLVDNVDFRDQLRSLEPEAMGGEMEGAGLYAACHDDKVDWIMVKAICDWADGNKGQDKDARQQIAAQNAAEYVIFCLGFSQIDWVKKRGDVVISASLNMQPTGSKRQLVYSSIPSQPFFFGREKELETIAEAISPEARTWGALIDGPGGIGKTALAIRAGHLAASENFDRKIFVSAKVRELTSAGEQKLEDFMFPDYIALITELARELGEENISQTAPNERVNVVRRLLSNMRALIVIDNVETFPEIERTRLYQFLSRLPASCKAIVTSRRRADIDARVIRLDRLKREDALALIIELGKNNRHLEKANEKERDDLYEITCGNPLLIRWTVGQLGREGSQCRTIPEACEFLKTSPKGNDPLEYIFGDLLDTFTLGEISVLSALVHFTQPVPVELISSVAGIPEPVARTALEDLIDRSLLVNDMTEQRFFLPPLAATFLRRKRPEVIIESGNRLTDRIYALVLENGYRQFEQFSKLESEWLSIAAAIPLFQQGDYYRLQTFCDAMMNFMNFTNRWDEFLAISNVAEEKALANKDFYYARKRVNESEVLYGLRDQTTEKLECNKRYKDYYNLAQDTGTESKAYFAINQGALYIYQENYQEALKSYQEAIGFFRVLNKESWDLTHALHVIARIEAELGDLDSAERDFQEGLRIAKKNNLLDLIILITIALSELALMREDWKTGETFAFEGLFIAQKISWIFNTGYCSLLIAEALIGQERRQEGLVYAQQGMEIFTRLNQQYLIELAQEMIDECGG